MRTTSRSLPALLLAAGLFCAPAPAPAAPPGTLIIMDKAVEATEDNESFEKRVKAAATTTLHKGADGGWHVYFAAWLRKKPGAEEINIVFYEPGKGRDPVHAYDLRTRADAKVLVSDVSVSPDDGLKSGKKYDVRITRLSNGHEEVFARTNLELAD